MDDGRVRLSFLFDLPSSRAASQTGVALRLPPHSKATGAATERSPSHNPLGKCPQ